jgi:hypothetical protein
MTPTQNACYSTISRQRHSTPDPLAKYTESRDLYRDVSVEDINELEKGLSVLENHAARVISDLHKALQTGSFTAKRREVNLLRKFLFIMHYRSNLLSKTYFQEDHPENRPLRDWLKSFRQKHGLRNSTACWLFALRYYMNTPHSQICLEAEQMYEKYGHIELANMSRTRIDPGADHYLAIAYEQQAHSYFLSFWEAADGAEFILGHNSFGLWEGSSESGGSQLHRIFVVSPRIVAVLRTQLMRTELLAANLIPLMEFNTVFLDVKANTPIPTYRQDFSDDPEGLAFHRTTPQADNDTFTFIITKLTQEQTQAFNSVILWNARREGFITFSSKEHALRAVRGHFNSLYGSLERPRFQPLIQQLLGPSTEAPPATTIVPAIPTFQQTSFSATVSDMELYKTLLYICTGEEEYPTDAIRADTVLKLIMGNPESRSTFAVEHCALMAGAIQRYMRRETFVTGKDRPPPVNFLIPLTEVRSAQLFAAFEPLMESLGVPVPSNDRLDQVMHQVVIIGFISWATHDVQIFESVKRQSAELAAVLSCETEKADENGALFRKAKFEIAMGDILAGSAKYRSRYDRAHHLYLFTLDEGLTNPFTTRAREMTCDLTELFRDLLWPPPSAFTRNTHAELVDSMSEESSNLLFGRMETLVRRLGADVSELALYPLMVDTAIIGLLSWVVKDRHDVLPMFNIPGGLTR